MAKKLNKRERLEAVQSVNKIYDLYGDIVWQDLAITALNTKGMGKRDAKKHVKELLYGQQK